MKNPWFTIPAASLLGAAVLFTGCSEQTSETPPQKPMHPAVSQLDLNGDFLLFMNTSNVEKRIIEQIDVFVSMAKTHGNQEETAQIDAIAETVKGAFEWSGILSIDSFSMSMKTVEGDLNRVITIAEHGKEDSTKALWRILASDPAVLKGIQYAPADAVYTVNSTASLNELWKVANEALEEFFPPEANQEVAQQIAMVEALLDASLNDLFGSLGNECLVSIQLSETKQCTIPIGGETLAIPEPSLIIGLQTKDPRVGKLILAKLKEAAVPVATSQHGDHTLNTLNLPVPMPFPVQPTLVQTEDYLLIGSSLEAIKKALDSQANQNGLLATALYKKLLVDAPEKTSGIEFLSPRFMQTYINAIKQAMAPTAGASELGMIGQMLGGYANIYSGGYSLKTPTGIYSKSYADYGGAKPIEMVASTYVGMLSAIAIPSFQKARSNSQDKMCQNNRRILDAAKEQWDMENGKTHGTPVTEADITEYIKGGFPALQCPKGGTYSINAVGTAPACSVHGPLR